jgi:multiple sugar transport system permease protein
LALQGLAVKRATERFAWAMVLPTFVVIFFILVLPLLYSFYISFHRVDLAVLPTQTHWAGFANYAQIFSSPQFARVLRFTVTYTVASVGGELVLGFGLALLLQRAPYGRKLFTSLLILPMMMTPIVSGLIWRMLYNPTYGAINQIFGLGNVTWLGEPLTAQVAVILTTIWQNTPFVMIFILAGLSSLPREPYEAALIDGASRLQSFRYITLPLLMPIIAVALLIRTIFEFREFDSIWILTTGGPAGATETLSLLNFRMSFRHFAVGPGAALSWIMLGLTVLISLGYIALLTRVGQRRGE